MVLSVCSGIGTDAVAWRSLGWEHLCFAEIEKFPSAVLAYRWPGVKNEGDFTKIGDKYRGAADLLVGGTPCQSFSVAGLRGGLADDRGNLALEFLRLADRTRPRWVVWENVPGVLSSNGGRDFGSILGGLGQLGYGWAYRVLDAQYFGVPQRRRRVFVVGHLGDWRAAAAVLFERHSLQGNHPPRREKGQGFTHDVAPCIGASGRGFERTGDTRGQDAVIAHSLRADGLDASEDGTGRGTPIVPCAFEPYHDEHEGRSANFRPTDTHPTIRGPHGADNTLIAFSAKDSGGDACEDLSPTLRAGGHSKSHANAGVMSAVAFQEAQTGCREYDSAGTLRSNGPGHDPVGTRIRHGMAVRRLTPRECERLQGLEDDYTLVPYNGKMAADGPRYKAIGNGMAVPVVKWIGERIQVAQP